MSHDSMERPVETGVEQKGFIRIFMKTLLIAINAKYIHSNLAVYSLKASAGSWKDEVEIAEYTINHLREDILADIYRRKPDVAAFSCYIWNMEYVQSLLKDLKKVLPDTEIWLGGPEVSYDCEEVLEREPNVRRLFGNFSPGITEKEDSRTSGDWSTVMKRESSVIPASGNTKNWMIFPLSMKI